MEVFFVVNCIGFKALKNNEKKIDPPKKNVGPLIFFCLLLWLQTKIDFPQKKIFGPPKKMTEKNVQTPPKQNVWPPQKKVWMKKNWLCHYVFFFHGILSASVKRFNVSHMRDFLFPTGATTIPYSITSGGR